MIMACFTHKINVPCTSDGAMGLSLSLMYIALALFYIKTVTVIIMSNLYTRIINSWALKFNLLKYSIAINNNSHSIIVTLEFYCVCSTGGFSNWPYTVRHDITACHTLSIYWFWFLHWNNTQLQVLKLIIRNSYWPTPEVCMQYRSTNPEGKTRGMSASILHTKRGIGQ